MFEKIEATHIIYKSYKTILVNDQTGFNYPLLDLKVSNKVSLITYI